MSHVKIQRKAAWLLTASCVVFCVAGCGPSKREQSLRKQNNLLKQRVSELEYQLEQGSLNTTAPADEQGAFGESVYLVVEGDSLWSIARKQLGSGTRYKEILALNPQLSKDIPLKIGTKIKLPAK